MSRFTFTFDGNIGRAPELRITEGGDPVTTFSVAYDRRRQNGDGEWRTVATTWYSVTAWGPLAEQVAELRKGDRVTITCRDDLRVRTYETRQGTTGVQLEVTANNVTKSLGSTRKAAAEAAEPAEHDWPEGATETREPQLVG